MIKSNGMETLNCYSRWVWGEGRVKSKNLKENFSFVLHFTQHFQYSVCWNGKCTCNTSCCIPKHEGCLQDWVFLVIFFPHSSILLERTTAGQTLVIETWELGRHFTANEWSKPVTLRKIDGICLLRQNLNLKATIRILENA